MASMKLRVNRQEFAGALTAVTGVVATRTPKPVLQCVLLDAQQDSLIACCTDLEVGMRCGVGQVEIFSPGVALVNAETLSRIVRESEDEALDIELKGNTLHVRGEGSHFQIVASDPEEFPAVAPFDEDADIMLPASEFQQLIEWTVYACAKESTRYAINGVLTELKGGTLTLVATDGRRLAKADYHADAEKTARAIVPVKPLTLFSRLSGTADEPTHVRWTNNQFMLRSRNAMIVSTLVEGNFPNYSEVIPQDGDKTAEIETAALLSGLRRAALLTNEESRGVRFAFEKNTLTLSSRAPEQGEAMIALPVRYTGAPITMGFNPVFMIDALKAARPDRVTFQMKDPQKPGLLKTDERFLYVVMPVNL